ncbi:chorismate-binding protein [Lacinutrix undariae]
MTTTDFFTALTSQLEAQLPFVAYRKPKMTTVKALLQNTDELHTITDYTESGFVMAPFDDRELSILIPSDISKTIEIEFSSSSNHISSTVISSEFKISEKNAHVNLVQKGIDTIGEDTFKKVVLSREEVVETSEDPLVLFQKILETYPTAFVYCWYHPKVGMWLGATPETLLKTENKRFKTMALAGTQEYKGTLDVKWTSKEYEEQQFVTDYIIANFKSEASRISVSDTKTVKAGNLLHLQTEISGILTTKNLKSVLDKLHPTPAVCGVPRAASKAFILKEELYNRAFYSGFLGELNIKEKTSRNTNRRNVENNAYAAIKTVSNLFVNLRCMQWQDDEVTLYLGGGITKDSNAVAEWEETVAKAKVMKKVL